MQALSVRGSGLCAPHYQNGALRARPIRPASVCTRSVCRPVLLAPGPRSPRRQRSRLVTRNFKPSEERPEEAPVARPRPARRHPLTEDPFSGASPAETATQEVIFGGAGGAAVRGFLASTTNAAGQMVSRILRPRALLRSLARNAAAYGLPVALVFFLALVVREPVGAFWAFYCASLDSNPLATKVATGVVGTILGDFIAQKLSYDAEVGSAMQRGVVAPPFVFDSRRTIRLAIYTAVVNTPIGHAWFKLLDTHVMPEAMTSPTAVLTKMALDQLVMCPVSTAVFFVAMRLWEGHPHDALAYMSRKMGPTLKANYLLWPIAHIVNFAFVPPSQRILYCNAVGILWTVILSTIQNAPLPPAPETTAAAAGGGDGSSGPFVGGGASAPSGSAPTGRGNGAGGFAGPARQPATSWRGPGGAPPGITAPAGSMYGGAGRSDEGNHQIPVKGRITTVQPAGISVAYMRFTKPGTGDGDA